MRIKYIPIRSDKNISYTFGQDIIIVELNGVADTFDFSNFTEGHAEVSNIETELSINPIASAKIENGELIMELVRFIGPDATHEERFPEWEVIYNG